MVYGLLNLKTNVIDHAIVYDGVSEYIPPIGYELIEMPDGGWIGWTMSEGGTWIAPPEKNYDEDTIEPLNVIE